MIVVSGVLVFVALVFLIIGLLGEGLMMIWLSIGTSVVAGVFLLLGALQRRGAPAPAAQTGGATAPEMLERVTAVSVRPREEAAEPAAAAGGGEVSVVPGRPRYHVASCRFLAGRPDVETIAVDEARAEGYTACGVCKPDAALESAAAAPAEEETAAFAPVGGMTDTAMSGDGSDEDVEADEPMEEPAEAPAPAKKAPAKRAAAKSTAAPAKAARSSRASGTTAAAAAKPAKKVAAAAKTASAGASTAQVVVIPDRGKFHTEACRFVKDVAGTVTLSKTAAKRQGYAPCGVCKP